MTKPVRLRLSRAKGFNLQQLSRQTNGLPAVNCARPSPWGNPHRLHDMLPHFDNDRVRATEAIVRAFRDWLTDTSDGRALLKRARQELRGHNLACWCPPGPCHCDIWLKLVNR